MQTLIKIALSIAIILTATGWPNASRPPPG